MKNWMIPGLALVTTTVFASDQVPEPVDPTVEEAPDQSAATEDQDPADVGQEWTPRLVFTLHTQPGGRPVIVRMPVQTVVPETVYEDESQPDGTVVRRAVVKPRNVRRTEHVSVRGTAILSCDAITFGVSHEGESPKYRFECKGRLQLRIGSSVIRAASGSFQNGQLQLVDATVTQAGIQATAEKLTVTMALYGLASGRIPDTGLLPTPDPGFRREPTRSFEDDAPFTSGPESKPDAGGFFDPAEGTVPPPRKGYIETF